MNEVRRFMPGEFLNTCFTARKWGLYLAKEVDEFVSKLAKHYDSFPDNFWVCGSSRKHELEEWLDEYYEIIDSHFIEKGEKE